MKLNVLFIIFNKREETKRVFDIIRSQQPQRLFIAADGPRIEKEGESETCQYVRNWVLNQIDWECEVKTLFRDQNIGCGRGPSEAITWFFDNVEEGIILEDDCLPSHSFFRFAVDLLEKYRYNNQLSIISGNNFQQHQPMSLDSDYYFSIFPSTNGWASWKRTWEGYDYSMSNWSHINKRKFTSFLFKEMKYKKWWQQQFNWVYESKPNDMWDYQFHYHCMARKQYAIIPISNLISNIGYGPDATHSQNSDSYFANVPTHEFNFPLRHPDRIIRNYEADIFIQDNLFGSVEMTSTLKKFKRLIKKLIKHQSGESVIHHNY